MTTEFRIDRPGVYRMRNGKTIYVWPLMVSRDWCIAEEDHTHSVSSAELYFTNGRLLQSHETAYDIIAYVSPLPTDILQRMREALALAEGDEPQSPTVEQRLRHKCSVCGEWPNERGVLHHGRGCYVTHKGGGGCTYVDFSEEPNQ